MKMSKLAIAIAALAPFAASAATITTSLVDAGAPGDNIFDAPDAAGIQFAREVLLTDGLTVWPDQSLGYSTGIALSVGDTVTFTFSRAPLDSLDAETSRGYPFPSSITALDGDGTLSLSAQTDTTVTYAVTATVEVDDDFIIVDDNLTFAAGTGDVTVSSATANAAGTILGDTATQTLVDDTGNEFSLALDAATLGDLIDVSAATPKTVFDDDSRSASFSISLDDIGEIGADGPDLSLLQTDGDDETQLTVTITGGNFSWLDTELETDGIQAELADEITVVGATATLGADTDLDAGTIVLVMDDIHNPDNENTITVTLESPVENTLEIPEQSMTVTAVLQGLETSAGVALPAPVTLATVTGTDAYTLNGSNVVVYAVPVSNRIQNFIYLSNSSSISGSVFVSVVDDGTTYGPFELGTSEPDTEFDIGARFIGAVNQSGATLSGKRVRLEISAELPANASTVSASYRSILANDRVNLLTDQETN